MKKIRILLLTTILVCCLTSCQKQTDLTKYISEYRKNIFYGENENYKITATLTERETPYCNDGLCGNISPIFEVCVSTQLRENGQILSFDIKGVNYSGELSFDNLKQCYKYSQTFTESLPANIDFKIISQNFESVVSSKAVLPDNAISTDKILSIAMENYPDKVNALLSNGVFQGEIQIRLIYEDENCYYYVGIVDKNKEINALLINAISGKVIATKTITN